MGDYRHDYWREAFMACVEELEVFDQLTSEQFDQAGKSLSMYAENESMAFGWDEADKSVRRMNREESENKVLRWVEEQMEIALYGSSKVLDYMTHEQKMALGRLQSASKAFRPVALTKAKGA